MSRRRRRMARRGPTRRRPPGRTRRRRSRRILATSRQRARDERHRGVAPADAGRRRRGRIRARSHRERLDRAARASAPLDARRRRARAAGSASALQRGTRREAVLPGTPRGASERASRAHARARPRGTSPGTPPRASRPEGSSGEAPRPVRGAINIARELYLNSCHGIPFALPRPDTIGATNFTSVSSHQKCSGLAAARPPGRLVLFARASCVLREADDGPPPRSTPST